MAAEYDEQISALVSALKAEEHWAETYQQSELQSAQIDALKRFFGDEYGDEVEGRSRVTTREGYECVKWLMPDLKRIFTSGDRVCEFEGVTPEGDQHAEAASDYLNWVFLTDNPGERILGDFIFDGLVQRQGVIAAEWSVEERTKEQETSGLGMAQVQKLLSDPNVEILGQDVEVGQPDEAHPDGLFYALKIKRRERIAKADIFTIAPEDFRVAARAVDLETARYCGDVVRMMRGEAKKKWPDYAEEIDAHQGDTSGFNTDERRAERFRDTEGWDAGSADAGSADSEASEIEILREYIRHDLDGDGYPELIRCYRLGDCLLDHEEVDEHIYSNWGPIPIPHRLTGLSIMDETKDLQRTKTVLLRSMLDSVYQSVAPRLVADTNKVTPRGLDALLTVRPGVVIETNGSPGDAVMPLVTPDLSVPALNAMQWVDRILESRTGVTRQAQGFDPDLLHDTAKGVELLQNAASVCKEEIARNLASGLERFFMKLYRLVHKHQNEARAVKIAGEWKNIDPRAWEADMRCTVSTGLGTGAREKQLMMLQMIQQDQVAYVSAYGPATPIVTPQHMLAVVEEKMRVMGYKSKDRFFGEPFVQNPQTGQMEPFVPQPPPSPDQQKIQAQIQEGQARLQLDAQKMQVGAQLEAQKAQVDAQVRQMEAEAGAASDARKAELDAAIQRMKAEGELAIMREKAVLEAQLKREQMAFEMQMAAAQFEFEKEMAREKLEIQRQQAKAKANGSMNGSMNGSSSGVSGANFGGDPG